MIHHNENLSLFCELKHDKSLNEGGKVSDFLTSLQKIILNCLDLGTYKGVNSKHKSTQIIQIE